MNGHPNNPFVPFRKSTYSKPLFKNSTTPREKSYLFFGIATTILYIFG